MIRSGGHKAGEIKPQAYFKAALNGLWWDGFARPMGVWAPSPSLLGADINV
jgi:hypothetical protein